MRSTFKQLLQILICLLAASTQCRAQTQSWGAWAPVAKADCECPVPVDVCCKVANLVCERRDSAAVFTPGTNGRVLSALGRCLNCPTCCKRGDCGQINPLNCGVICSVSFTQSFNFSISPKITGDIAEAIKFELAATVGWTWQTNLVVTAKCEIAANACQRIVSRAAVSFVKNRKAQIVHQWRLSGSWINPGSCPSCPIPGTFFKACGETSSTATADIALTNDCENLCTDKCSPGECDTYN